MIKQTTDIIEKVTKIYNAVKEVLLWAIISVLIFTNNVLSKFSLGKYTMAFIVATIFFSSVTNLVFTMYKESLV